jgi:hypothetical protein
MANKIRKTGEIYKKKYRYITSRDVILSKKKKISA